MASLQLHQVGLDLPIYDLSHRSLKRRVLGLARGARVGADAAGAVVVTALHNIDLQLASGDRLGLIGRNGAGKSSLLRVMAGIFPPSRGRVDVDGQVVPLLDIALGMDEQSSGWDNIRLRAMLLGMREADIRAKRDDIAAFTELGDSLFLPLRTYSSGMRLRLAFAVSTAVDADILLLDEVLGVGDAAFVDKAEARMRQLQQRAEIVVLAIHAPEVIARTCNKVLWLEAGQTRMIGDTAGVLDAYQRSAQTSAEG